MFQEKYYQTFLRENPYPRQLISYENNAELSVVEIYLGEKKLINFSSSDYLGLSKHPLLIERSQEYARNFGIGSCSSRLVVGHSELFQSLENKLAIVLKKPAALILGTGYQTNFTVLEALLDKKVLGHRPIVFCDKWCHSSLISSVRQFADMHRFRHNDLNHLQEFLDVYSNSLQPKFIIIESLYSMDGDHINMEQVTQLAKQFNAFLYVDDAHSVGMEGPEGWGYASSYSDQIDIIMGTFSKGLGSFGSYIACSETLKDYLVNKCKGLIYSTALPMPVLGAISAAIDLVPTLQESRTKVRDYTKKILTFFQENHLNCGSGESHIIPWIIGDSDKTLYASELLKEEGILGVTIRPPSVPLGKSRIRFCLSAAHEDEHIEQLMKAILKVARRY